LEFWSILFESRWKSPFKVEFLVAVAVVALLFFPSCAHRRPKAVPAGWSGAQVYDLPLPGPPPEETTPADALTPEAQEFKDALKDQILLRLASLLAPAEVAPPGVDPQPQRVTSGDLALIIAPIRAEKEDWNLWNDGSSRLFNDSRGYLWSVDIQVDQPVRWLARTSVLRVNARDSVFPAAASADECFRDLVLLAWWRLDQELGLDLQARLDAAGPFRENYLPEEIPAGSHRYVLFFPAPAVVLDPVAMELTLQFYAASGGNRTFTLLFE